MKKLTIIFSTMMLILSPLATANIVHWSAEVKKIIVDDNAAKIYMQGVRHPNPSGSQWSCNDDIASLGEYSNPVPTSLKLSAAMEAYKSGNTVRVGVEGSDDKCKIKYITLN